MDDRDQKVIRCGWVTDDPQYLAYHDEEWGVPVYDDRVLFEMLILEGAQAGLSWITILRKREGYRAAFAQFDPEAIARFGEADVERLMEDTGLVRNRLKIRSVISNAKAWLEIMKQGEGAFSNLVWSVVSGQTLNNRWEKLSDVPASTAESEALSRLLKKKGFRFVGPTICYAFMQACGLVNDHVTDCFRYEEIEPR
ncbi:DNA-3-methyladenine glycosylase I [Kiloniella laminariae]|uniref:DNA-3-methyladenine glycosylase I n=1 Tax=Kiloniella laminariae TaxID=454162 RepID=A0ABT4LJ31_9PROT|nr:DNA-3-methyladenine glycosylase I [Kiloniella laminariae]MCZ4280950.1 DNA-3-methyladenine glycosylase I [Kiloniella laminariae]